MSGTQMIKSDDIIDLILPGKKIKAAHESRGHGDVLTIDFDDGTKLSVWAFGHPKKLQMVLHKYNNALNRIEIIKDMRHQDCKEYTDIVFRGLVERYPHVYGVGGSDPLPPFRTYHEAIFYGVECEKNNG